MVRVVGEIFTAASVAGEKAVGAYILDHMNVLRDNLHQATRSDLSKCVTHTYHVITFSIDIGVMGFPL